MRLILLFLAIGIVGLLLLEFQPFAVDSVHEHVEAAKIVAGDAMVTRILAERTVVDRPFAPECPIEAVILEGVEGPEIEFMPKLWLEIFVGSLRLQPLLFGEG